MSPWALALLATTGCTKLYSYPGVDHEDSALACSDGQDNDLDGKADCRDEDCKAFCVESSNATCHDGKDNDQDGKVDCRDEACAAFCPEATAAACSDGQDNDSDGKTDCDDRDCDGFCPEETLADCNDGRDNDGDGLVDAADPRCWLLAAPEVQRCADAKGVDFFETFDGMSGGPGQFIFSPWSTQGKFSLAGVDQPVFFATRRVGSLRQDLAFRFSFNTTGEHELHDSNLGTLTRTWQMSGSWPGFELSFKIGRGRSFTPGLAVRVTGPEATFHAGDRKCQPSGSPEKRRHANVLRPQEGERARGGP
jgi:hypothetical protein